MKKYPTVIVCMVCLLALTAGALMAQDNGDKPKMKVFSLSVGAGMRSIGDNLYKEVYENGGVFFYADMAYRIAKPIEIFVHGEMFKKEGKTTFTHDDTTLKITPLEAGIRLIIAGKNPEQKLFPYLGVGAGYYLINEENVIGVWDEKKFGFFGEGGLRFFLMDSVFIDVKGKYTSLKVKLDETNERNLGGFVFMGGVGFSL